MELLLCLLLLLLLVGELLLLGGGGVGTTERDLASGQGKVGHGLNFYRRGKIYSGGRKQIEAATLPLIYPSHFKLRPLTHLYLT